MARGKREGVPNGRVGLDVLEALTEWRRYERSGRRYTNEGRWDERRRAEHVAKLKRTRERKWREKWRARPKRPPKVIQDPFGFSIQERILLHMVPGEWLATTDLSERTGLPTRRINPKLLQQMLPRGMVVRSRDPEARTPAERLDCKGARNPQFLYTLTALGCAIRADRLELAELMGAPVTMPPSDWKIPKKFLQSFGIDFSPFFDPHAGGTPRRAAARRAARALALAGELAQRAPHAEPWEVCGLDGAEAGQKPAKDGKDGYGGMGDT